MRSPCQSTVSRPPVVTSPMTTASTSHRAQMARKPSMRSGATIAHIRSCDSLMRISSGDERRVAQGHAVQPHVHAALAVGRQLAGGAGDPGPAEVLDALDQPGVQDLQRALDEQLLHERVADLHAGPLGGTPLVERLRRQHADPADAVAAGPGAVQHDQVADTARGGEVDLVGAHGAHAQRVDQRVADVGRVEDDLPADVRQAQAVAVPPDARHHARQHAAVSGASSGPNRSGSITASGRAPIDMMSRTIPPTPVAAPWYGST